MALGLNPQFLSHLGELEVKGKTNNAFQAQKDTLPKTPLGQE